MKKLLLLAVASPLLFGLPPISAEDVGVSATEPFHYAQGFESDTDPVRFWTSYKKEYTVNFKGSPTSKRDPARSRSSWT